MFTEQNNYVRLTEAYCFFRLSARGSEVTSTLNLQGGDKKPPFLLFLYRISLLT